MLYDVVLMVHFWRVFHRWLPGDPFSEAKPPTIFIVHFVPIILFLHRRRFKKDMTGFKIGYFWILRRKKNLSLHTRHTDPELQAIVQGLEVSSP